MLNRGKMRILDKNGKELKEKDINLKKGYIKEEQLFVKHHDAVQEQPEKFHYEVAVFHFEDGTEFHPSYQDGKSVYVKNIDAGNGVFDFIDVDKTGKKVRGTELRLVIDSKGSPAKEAYDEYETIGRYILYTDEELKQNQEEERKNREREFFLNQGFEKLENLETQFTALATQLKELQSAFMNKSAEIDEKIQNIELELAKNDRIGEK